MPQTTRRRSPYIWITWLTGLLSGRDACEWALWFKAQHVYDKLPKSVDLTIWTAEHGAMITAEAARLRTAGYTVTVEDQNALKLQGEAATIAGKPDLLAVSDTECLVVDCKTGRPKDSDVMQILGYLFMLPRTRPDLIRPSLRGELRYRDARQTVHSTDLTPAVQDRLIGLIRQGAGQDGTPTRTPSPRECRFCDISAKDCPDRIEEEPQAPKGTAVTQEF